MAHQNLDPVGCGRVPLPNFAVQSFDVGARYKVQPNRTNLRIDVKPPKSFVQLTGSGLAVRIRAFEIGILQRTHRLCFPGELPLGRWVLTVDQHSGQDPLSGLPCCVRGNRVVRSDREATLRRLAPTTAGPVFDHPRLRARGISGTRRHHPDPEALQFPVIQNAGAIDRGERINQLLGQSGFSLRNLSPPCRHRITYRPDHSQRQNQSAA